MDHVLPLLFIVAFAGAGTILRYRQSGGRMWSPPWLTFSASAFALLFVVAGLIGYTLDKHDQFIAHTAWTGHVIWFQVWVGLLAGFAAVYFWRRTLVGRRDSRPVRLR